MPDRNFTTTSEMLVVPRRYLLSLFYCANFVASHKLKAQKHDISMEWEVDLSQDHLDHGF